MKPEEQRIAIAEACGWRYEITDTTVRGLTCWNRAGGKCPGQFILAGDCFNRSINQMQELLEFCHVPDYLNDLNAMQAALIYAYNTQPPGWANLYENTLIEVCSHCQYTHWSHWCATAEDQAKALLISLNLWTA